VLEGEKILVTGPTSQVALPIVRELAKLNQVLGLARFTKPGDAERVAALGVEPLRADLADGVPEDVSLVLHFAVVKSGDFAYDLAANAEGVGHLMARCRRARAFVHCSSAAVYEGGGHTPRREDAPWATTTASCSRRTRSRRSPPRAWCASAPVTGTCRR
jgi:UDP-glucuronate 4-epimerase